MREQFIQHGAAVTNASCRLVEMEKNQRETNISEPEVIFDDQLISSLVTSQPRGSINEQRICAFPGSKLRHHYRARGACFRRFACSHSGTCDQHPVIECSSPISQDS